jgi:sialate O-acetylesterase
MNILSRALKVLALAVLAFSPAAFAAESNATANSDSLKLPAIFGDNMVLQQQQAVPIWGWSAPHAPVTVKFAGQSQSTHANARGFWRVKLAGMPAAATPQSLVIESGGTKVFTNILVGEVWVCSGQSNMEKPIDGRPNWNPCFNATQDLAAANYPGIRLFKVEQTLARGELNDFQKVDAWRPCDSNALQTISFSAAAYFFGREIHTNLNVPVGLIESSWGGTRIEPWTPKAGFDSVRSLARLGIPVAKSTAVHATTPTAIYNAMIAPMAGFAIRGALWYQGEANCAGTSDDDAYLAYADKMAALIGGWRKVWGEGDFPFYFVQIAPYRYYGRDKMTPSAERLPEFWTVQSRAERMIKNTGMVVTTDLVDDLNDIHPRNKQDVGHRLALLARNQTYGENVVASGPVFKELKIEGNKAILTFDHVDGGLMSRDNQPLTWFAIAGADGRFVEADATIVGDTLQVSSPGVEKPEAVRFAWRETAQPNFCDKAGLPAEPFRTDNPVK